MKVFVPFSEELFEYAGRHASRVLPGALQRVEPQDGSAATSPLDGLGELVPFRFDYRCLRLKAPPAPSGQHA